MDNLDIVSELLFGEKLESLPDPNLPENQVRIKIMREERAESLRRLKNGPGKALFEMWDYRLKREIISLLNDPKYRQCGCPAAQLIMRISTLVDLWAETERAIREEKE